MLGGKRVAGSASRNTAFHNGARSVFVGLQSHVAFFCVPFGMVVYVHSVRRELFFGAGGWTCGHGAGGFCDLVLEKESFCKFLGLRKNLLAPSR